MFSLLLIVSVISTTLGSAIKAKNPNREELEPLLEPSDYSNPRMNSRDQVSEKQKRLAPATVIAGASLGITVLKEVLAAIGSVKRKIAIGIDNESAYNWEASSSHFVSGTSDQTLPYRLKSGYALLYPARKTNSSLRGVVGVVAYCIPHLRSTIAFMFSVPYDYTWYDNSWNVKLYSGERRASYSMYEDMYYNAYPFPANGGQERDLGYNLKVEGAMASSGQPTLEIHVGTK